MNATEMKKYLVAFSKTLDDVNKDESYGTARDEWNNIYPQFLAWYNSHHNRVIAKEHRQNKTLNLTMTVEEADFIISAIEKNIRDGLVSPKDQDGRRDLIGRIQQTDSYLRQHGIIQ